MKNNTKFYWTSNPLSDVWIGRIANPLAKGVIVGEEMVYQIGAYPDFESHVQLIAPFGGIDPMGNPIPTRREYPVAGSFRSGFFEYDTKYVLMKYDEAKRLLKSQGRYGFNIMLNDPATVGKYVKRLKNFLGDRYVVSGWAEKNRRLFAALKLERIAMSFLLFLIIIIASFSIIGVTLMIFFSKRRDLAIIMALGASRATIERIFLLHGGLIGFLGALIGMTLGGAGCYFIARSNIALPPSYYLDYLPISVNGYLIFAVAAGGILMSVLASYYPAHRAAEIDPIELLRYE